MKIGNWPLLLLAVEHIIKHKDQYDQCVWRSDCGSFRCLAGWIAFFAGYRDVIDHRFLGVSLPGKDAPVIGVEEAALTALELDPEIYGSDTSEDRWAEMDSFADDLFAGNLALADILTVVRDFAKADGVTPTPVVMGEMLTLGIVTDWTDF